MRPIILLVLSALILSACTSKTNTQNSKVEKAATVDKGASNQAAKPTEKVVSKPLNETTTTKNNNAVQVQQGATKQEPQASTKQEAEPKVQQTTTNQLTHEQAVQLVKEHLNIQSNSKVKAVYKYDAENGDYIIQVYEFVVDNPSTGEGHTATRGWYGVNKQTKVVYDAMK
ncbi:hypothetical protein [Neobacillus cucumis]|uniref:hypothetical protein n=1 Tax=Neobacillus cucumis TaxID=1740721 RepID=UPI002853023E|nr:hypothetical protein [Neobacillus cucumis]MDR4948998.1 hypothetical protein [Neobacillus cucumis]